MREVRALGEASQVELDKAAYALATDYLLRSGADKGVTLELIEKYLHLSKPRPSTVAGLYERILESAQNANMKALPEEAAQGFLRAELEEPSQEFVHFTVRPDRWLSFDFAEEGEG